MNREENESAAGTPSSRHDSTNSTEISLADVETPKQISILKFFTYITTYDKLLLFVGTTSAIAAGAVLPSISLIMANVSVAFTGSDEDASSDLISDMSFIASYVILIAASLFIFSYMFYAFWQHLAENIVTDLRRRYLRALMRQEVAYFEINKVEEIPVQMNEIFETVKASIGEQVSNLIFAVSTLVASCVYGLSFGP